jgi:L-asparaginase / beta-aspartyl-peptidase
MRRRGADGGALRSLIVHGGAWQIPDTETNDHISGIHAALEHGIACLRSGAPALDVVVETIALLEDDPTFDAGRGSVLTRDGTIEMDASIMDGTYLRAGACACVRDVANPIRLARAILEDGRAVFLAGEGASRFARAVGIPACRFEDLVVEREVLRKERLESLDAYKTRMPFDGSLPPLDRPLGTIGAVCFDQAGRLAAATSTGGAPFTMAGRIGDSPVLGAGTWAEDGVGAACSTGWGEGILREILAFRAVQEIDTLTIERRRSSGGYRPAPYVAPEGLPGLTPDIAPGRVTWGPVPPGVRDTPEAKAAKRAIQAFARRINGVGGVILLGPDGNPGFAFNTPRMARGFWIEGMGLPTVEIDPA